MLIFVAEFTHDLLYKFKHDDVFVITGFFNGMNYISKVIRVVISFIDLLNLSRKFYKSNYFSISKYILMI